MYIVIYDTEKAAPRYGGAAHSDAAGAGSDSDADGDSDTDWAGIGGYSLMDGGRDSRVSGTGIGRRHE